MPQQLPRDPAPVPGVMEDGVLMLEGAAFDAPTDPPEQHVNVNRDFWGRPQSLSIAVLTLQPPPTPDQAGVVIQLAPEAAALLQGRRLTIEVNYRPLAVNAASQLALSLAGPGPTRWVTQPIPPLSGSVRFNIPARDEVSGIGLRAVSNNQDPEAFGVEIVSIRAGARQR
jgi:hypothetical protein